MLFQCLPSWESCLWCGLETLGPFPTSTAPHCGPAPIGSTTKSLGQTVDLELEMVVRCTLSTHGHSDGHVICETPSGRPGAAAGARSGPQAREGGVGRRGVGRGGVGGRTRRGAGWARGGARGGARRGAGAARARGGGRANSTFIVHSLPSIVSGSIQALHCRENATT